VGGMGGGEPPENGVGCNFFGSTFCGVEMWT
jgi:hypothetical protein